MELIVDALVLVLTVIRSAQTYFSRGGGFKRRSGISVGGDLLRLILRDGVIYFAIMCCANLITVLMYLVSCCSPIAFFELDLTELSNKQSE